MTRITVVSNHRDYPGKWIGHIYPLRDEIVLKATTEQEAKDEVIATAKAMIEKMYQDVMGLQ